MKGGTQAEKKSRGGHIAFVRKKKKKQGEKIDTREPGQATLASGKRRGNGAIRSDEGLTNPWGRREKRLQEKKCGRTLRMAKHAFRTKKTRSARPEAGRDRGRVFLHPGKRSQGEVRKLGKEKRQGGPKGGGRVVKGWREHL